MALSKEELREYFIKLCHARNRVIFESSLLGILLVQFKLAVDENCDTVYFDGERIAFSPKLLDELELDEISHVLVHEMLHYIKGHFSIERKERAILDLACDMEVESLIYELNSHCYHGVGGYVIPYKLPGSRYVSAFSVDDAYDTLKSQKEIALYKSFDNHSKWENAKKSCQSQIHMKRAIALVHKSPFTKLPPSLESLCDMELDTCDIWEGLSEPVPSVEEIFEGNCKAVPKSLDTLLALIYQMVQYAKECRHDLRKISNSVSYACGMRADFASILFRDYCYIEKGYKDFLMKIPDFYKWFSTRGAHFNGII
ncbi:MAG: hypothetical protein IJ400_05735 [Clostridia bacterium]|nr:hypothetical protein [Clostridia bacterium]